MYNITICIPTYKRPEMLKKLLISIKDNNINKELIKDLKIIVVDNDFEGSAEKIIHKLIKEFPDSYQLHYYNYPEKGLANVRNEMFRRALEFNPDYIACIDDDEYTSSEWLNELVYSVTKNKGEISVGPVNPTIEHHVTPSISYWFKTETISNNKRINYFRTGNFIINANFLKDAKIKFDSRFNLTGGEDSYFGLQAIKKGAKLFWAANAIVYETVPQSRANIKWLMKRRYTNANNYTYILRLENIHLLLLKKIGTNFLYLGIGLPFLIVLPFNFKFRYWGGLKIAESIGSFAGLIRK